MSDRIRTQYTKFSSSSCLEEKELPNKQRCKGSRSHRLASKKKVLNQYPELQSKNTTRAKGRMNSNAESKVCATSRRVLCTRRFDLAVIVASRSTSTPKPFVSKDIKDCGILTPPQGMCVLQRPF